LIDESLLSGGGGGGPLTPPQSNPPAEEVPSRRRKVRKAPRRVEGEDVTLYAYVERLRMYALEGHEEAAAMLWDWETVGSRGDAGTQLRYFGIMRRVVKALDGAPMMENEERAVGGQLEWWESDSRGKVRESREIDVPLFMRPVSAISGREYLIRVDEEDAWRCLDLLYGKCAVVTGVLKGVRVVKKRPCRYYVTMQDVSLCSDAYDAMVAQAVGPMWTQFCGAFVTACREAVDRRQALLTGGEMLILASRLLLPRAVEGREAWVGDFVVFEFRFLPV
jgi:hypothetical protein